MRVAARPGAVCLQSRLLVFVSCDWRHKYNTYFNMTVFDILNLYQTPFRWMLKSGIHIEDVNYIDLYKDYSRMIAHGDKVTYVVAVLADKYQVSERKVYTLLKRLSHDCEPLEH